MRLSYSPAKAHHNDTSRLPLLSATLVYGNRQHQVVGLVDSGAMLSVLPFQVGLDLGAVWNEENATISLGGTMRGNRAMELWVVAKVDSFVPINLVFAWSQRNDVPVIFGQFNFFQEFDVHFYRSQMEFEINPKSQYYLSFHSDRATRPIRLQPRAAALKKNQAFPKGAQ